MRLIRVSRDYESLYLHLFGDETMRIIAGDRLSLRLSDRRCIGASPPDEAWRPCPDNASPVSGSRCSSCLSASHIVPCLRCTGERCFNRPRRSSCLEEESHFIYLASFAPGSIKVGVSWRNRVELRLLEQGARAGLVIGNDDGQQVRRIESQIRRLGISDRLSPAERLGYLKEEASPELLASELREEAELIRMRIMTPVPLSIPIRLRRQPAIAATTSLLSPSDGLIIEGEVEQLAGTLIVFRSQAKTWALDAHSLLGYRVEAAAAGQECVEQLMLI